MYDYFQNSEPKQCVISKLKWPKSWNVLSVGVCPDRFLSCAVLPATLSVSPVLMKTYLTVLNVENNSSVLTPLLDSWSASQYIPVLMIIWDVPLDSVWMKLWNMRRSVPKEQWNVFSGTKTYKTIFLTFPIYFVFRECRKEVRLRDFSDHVKANTCAINLQHIDEYEFVQGLFSNGIFVTTKIFW